jgi:hypothetical protein
MGRHVSVVMQDDLFEMMEKARGRESKSSFVNYALKMFFKHQNRYERGDDDAAIRK